MAHPAGEIDKNIEVRGIISEEFMRFNGLMAQHSKHPDFPRLGSFERDTTHAAGLRFLEALKQMPVLSDLVIAEGTLFGAEGVPMSYASADEVTDHTPRWSQPFVLANRVNNKPQVPGNGQSRVEIGIGWKLRVEDYRPEDLEGFVTSMRHGVSRKMGEYALTLSSEWDKEGSRLTARQYLGLPYWLAETPAQEQTVSQVPEDDQKKFAQAFREAAWEAVHLAA